MSLMRKERKSEYEKWEGWPSDTPALVLATKAQIELAKLRQMEQIKWVLEDLVDELREIRRQWSPRGLGRCVK